MTTETPAHAQARKRHSFTSETAKEAGRKSAEARAKRKAEQDARTAQAQREIEAFLGIDCTGETLGPGARSAAALIIARILRGDVNTTDAAKTASLLGKCHEIARLEEGQVTSLSGRVTLQLDEEQTRARIEGVRAAIDARSSVTVSGDSVTPQVSTPAPAVDVAPPAPDHDERER